MAADSVRPTISPPSRRSGASAARPQCETITGCLRFIITVTVMAATLLEILDTSVVNVAIPDMMGNLGATLDQIGWVATGYIISNVIVLPLTGWLSDYFGRKHYLRYSILLFTAASFMCGTSRSLGELIFWRVVQGAGGAAFLSTSQATLMEIYPPELRGMAQGLFGIGVVMAPTLGPTLGGYITDTYTWPWIFFVNVPIGIVATALTLLFVPDSASAGRRRAADFAGIGFLAVCLGCLQTVLERGERDDWFEATYIVVLTAISAIAWALFLWWEIRPGNRNPAVNLRVLKNVNLSSGCLIAFVLGFMLYGGNFAMPQFWQNVQSHSAEAAGLLLFPGGLATGLSMPVVGNLVNRIDARLMIGAGMCLFGFAMWQFSQNLALAAPDQAFFWPLITRGVGTGLMFVPLSVTALGTIPPRNLADGAGLYNLCRQIGGSFGIAALTTLLDRRQQLHYSRLSENIYSANPLVNQRLAEISKGLVAHGLAPNQAHGAAFGILTGSVQTQAAVMSYVDVFTLMFWVGILSVGLLFLMRRPRAGSHTAAVH